MLDKIFNNIKKHPPLILLVIILTIFSPTLITKKVLFYRDISINYYPLTDFVFKSIRNFEIPLWNPYIFSGFEQLASLEPPIFYPINFINLFLNFHTAIIYSLIIHYFLAGLGIYIICRHWGLSKIPSISGSIIFSLNSYMFELNAFIYILFSITWIPYIFLFSDKFLTNSNLKNFLLIILFSSLQISTGRFDYVYFTHLVLWPWIIYLIYKKEDLDFESIIKKVFLLITAFSISVGLLSVQIIPTLEFIKTTRRAEGMDINISTIWSLHPLQLLNLFFNNLFGNLMENKGISFVLFSDTKTTDFFIYNLYVGFISFIFSIIGIIKRKEKTIILSCSILFFTLISFGKYTPIYEFLFNNLPGFSISRYPEKLFVFSYFFFSLLFSIGLESFLSEKNTKIQKYLDKTILIISTTMIFILLLVFLNKENIINYFNTNILYKYGSEISSIGFIFKSLTFSLLILSIFILFKKNNKIKLSYIVLLIICTETILVNISNLKTVSISDYATPELVNDINNLIDDKRLYHIIEDNEGNTPILNNNSKVISDFKNSIESLNFNTSVNYQFLNSFGYYPGEPTNISIIIAALNDEIPNLKLSNKTKASIMRMMGIRFFIWHTLNQKTSPPDNINFKLIKNYDNSKTQLLELKDFKPRITFKIKAIVTEDENEILKAVLTSDEYSLDKDIVALKNDIYYRKALSLVPKSQDKNIKDIKIDIISESNNTLNIKAEVYKSGYLVISNRYSKGWVAFVNGKELPIIKANYYQQAIRINSGVNNVELKYEPYSFKIGKNISIIFLIVILFISIFLFIPKSMLKMIKNTK